MSDTFRMAAVGVAGASVARKVPSEFEGPLAVLVASGESPRSTPPVYVCDGIVYCPEGGQRKYCRNGNFQECPLYGGNK